VNYKRKKNKLCWTVQQRTMDFLNFYIYLYFSHYHTISRSLFLATVVSWPRSTQIHARSTLCVSLSMTRLFIHNTKNRFFFYNNIHNRLFKYAMHRKINQAKNFTHYPLSSLFLITCINFYYKSCKNNFKL